jgi:hypothetical protein
MPQIIRRTGSWAGPPSARKGRVGDQDAWTSFAVDQTRPQAKQSHIYRSNQSIRGRKTRSVQKMDSRPGHNCRRSDWTSPRPSPWRHHPRPRSRPRTPYRQNRGRGGERGGGRYRVALRFVPVAHHPRNRGRERGGGRRGRAMDAPAAAPPYFLVGGLAPRLLSHRHDRCRAEYSGANRRWVDAGAFRCPWSHARLSTRTRFFPGRQPAGCARRVSNWQSQLRSHPPPSMNLFSSSENNMVRPPDLLSRCR